MERIWNITYQRYRINVSNPYVQTIGPLKIKVLPLWRCHSDEQSITVPSIVTGVGVHDFTG